MLAEASRPSEPTTPPASSDRMSPNRFSVRMTSNSVGLRTSVIAAESTYMWESWTSEKPPPTRVTTSRQRREHFAQKPRALQNIRLVDGEHAPAPGASQLKGNAGDALDLRLTIAHGVDRLARAGSAFAFTFNRARLPEIQSAEQFAHDENVGSLDDFFAQRRARSQRRIKDCGTEIGESSEFLA